MSVDLPSSTEPAVANRRSSMCSQPFLEVALALAVFHAGLADAVVGPRGAALGDAGHRGLLDDRLDARCRRLDRTGTRGVADGAEADGALLDLLAVEQRDPRRLGQPHAVALEHPLGVGEVDGRQLDVLGGDVLPDVELGPVGQREHPDVLALAVAAVVEGPELGPLVLGVPLAEVVAEAEHALLGPGLLLVAPGAAEHGVEPVLVDRPEQEHCLDAVAAGPRTGVIDDLPGVDGVLHARDDEPHAQLGHPPVAVLEHLGEVVTRVDVHHRERQLGRGERLDGQVQHHRRVLATREQHDRPFELGRDLANDVDRLGLERLEVRQLVAGPDRWRSRGHGRPRLNPTCLVSNSDRSGKQAIMPPAPADDHVLAARLATEAGELLVGLRTRLSADGVDGRPLGAEGDRAAHELLMNRLGSARPGDAVLSEEGVADPARLDAERVWIVDPLDGTREFGELHRTDSAARVASALGGSLVPLGSAGAKAMAVVLGEAEVYPHSGGQHEWDSAAPVAVARAAGLHASRLDGSPLVYNRPDPYMPDVLICRPELADRVIAAAREG